MSGLITVRCAVLALAGFLVAAPATQGIAADATAASDFLTLCLATLPEVTPVGWWIAWSFSPWVIVPLATACVIYARGLRARRHLGHSQRAQACFFAVGVLYLVLALVSPLCRLSTTLAWVHMIQHGLLVAGAPLLLVLSRPGSVMLAGVPDRVRTMVGPWTIGLSPVPQQHSYLLGTFLLYGFNIWFWHIPSLYQGALLDTGIHLLMYGSLLLASLMFWHAMLVTYRRPGTLTGLAAVLQFFTFLHTGLLGILLTLSPRVWYPLIAARSAAWDLAPLDDQRLAGLIMWVPMGIVYFGTALALVAELISRSEQVSREGTTR